MREIYLVILIGILGWLLASAANEVVSGDFRAKMRMEAVNNAAHELEMRRLFHENL
jgi:hypothetical protein